MSAIAATMATRAATGLVASTRRQEDRSEPRVIYLTPDRLAQEITTVLEIHVTTKTLANWRSAGKGPGFIKVGRHVRYSLAEVRRWLATCRSAASGQGEH